ncbi:phosphotransferase [Devriesea agamarum]|uniref:phosphotransferase n=1 Tax=Devriesea agamarum TaxID=472569 RepID=UPI00071D0D40|nr:phosphotransferase [Devriesea agamarum]
MPATPLPDAPPADSPATGHALAYAISSGRLTLGTDQSLTPRAQPTLVSAHLIGAGESFAAWRLDHRAEQPPSHSAPPAPAAATRLNSDNPQPHVGPQPGAARPAPDSPAAVAPIEAAQPLAICRVTRRSPDGHAKSLAREVAALKVWEQYDAHADASSAPTPRVLEWQEDPAESPCGRSFLVTSYVPGTVLGPDQWGENQLLAHARALAALHRVDEPAESSMGLAAQAIERGPRSLLVEFDSAMSWWNRSDPDLFDQHRELHDLARGLVASCERTAGHPCTTKRPSTTSQPCTTKQVHIDSHPAEESHRRPHPHSPEHRSFGSPRRALVHGDLVTTNILWTTRGPEEGQLAASHPGRSALSPAERHACPLTDRDTFPPTDRDTLPPTDQNTFDLEPRYIDFEWARFDDVARDLAIIGGEVHGGPWYVPLSRDAVRFFVDAYAQEASRLRPTQSEEPETLLQRREGWEAYEKLAMLLHCSQRADRENSELHAEAAGSLRTTLTRKLRAWSMRN